MLTEIDKSLLSGRDTSQKAGRLKNTLGGAKEAASKVEFCSSQPCEEISFQADTDRGTPSSPASSREDTKSLKDRGGQRRHRTEDTREAGRLQRFGQTWSNSSEGCHNGSYWNDASQPGMAAQALIRLKQEDGHHELKSKFKVSLGREILSEREIQH